MRKVVPTNEFLRITNDYVSKITQAQFEGWESIDFMNGNLLIKIIKMGIKKVFAPFYQKTTNRTWNFWPIRTLYVSMNPDNFLDHSKEYIRNLLKASGFNLNEPILLNQAFEANNPEGSFPFFDNPKAIILDRDPRDIYIQHQLMVSGEGRWLPKGDVNAFIAQYKHVRKGQNRIDDQNKLFINFEELIYDYDNTVNKILKFISCDRDRHKLKRKYFKPEKSVNNTKLFETYPQFESEIKHIEKELNEYIFPFENYPIIEKSGQPFNA